MNKQKDLTKEEVAIKQLKCTHSGSKKGIFICGSSYEGVTRTEHVYICEDCGAIYLHRYEHKAAQGEERTDIIMPGKTRNGITFHEATAALIRLVHDAEGVAQLQAINRQAQAVRNYVLDRLEDIEHQEEQDEETQIIPRITASQH
jgi:hypothetical protein